MEAKTMRSERSANDQRVKRTYRELMKALEELICENTLEQMSVKQLCAAAMIQRTTFYQHFADMQDFLEWYIEQKQEEFRSGLAETLSMEQASNLFMSLAQGIMQFVKRNEKLVKSLMNTQINGKPLFDLYVNTCADELVKRMGDVPMLEERAGNTPIVFLAQFYAGGMIAAFRCWLLQDKPYSEEEFMRYLRLRVGKLDKQ